jgi:AcrR family transcriptional regulator
MSDPTQGAPGVRDDLPGVPVHKPSKSGRTSFIEQARRRQIVQAAIDVIAERGYAGASLEQIALKAGISRGLISYHFAGRDDLIAAVVASIFTE